MEAAATVAVDNEAAEINKEERLQDQINNYECEIYLREVARKELERERAELKERARNEDKKMTAAKFAIGQQLRQRQQRNEGKSAM